jgi:tetratricopeptide (TPR) repeat protein
MQQLVAAEAACGRILATSSSQGDRQRAAFFRGLMRFLLVVQKGADVKPRRDGALAGYTPPTLEQVKPALEDIEIAIGLPGPLQGEALNLRVTINQTIGRHAEARNDLDQALRTSARDATPFVQRALDYQRSGDAASALADLDRAIEFDPTAGTAFWARADLRHRLGQLAGARSDYAAAAALGPPFRRLALASKSDVELRAGDLRAAYDDLLAAVREKSGMPKEAAAAADAALLVQAGDLALDKLKDPDAAEKHYRKASRLSPKAWDALLGLARVEEQRGDRAKAAAIYRRILTSTRSTPKLIERILASLRLKQLTRPAVLREGGPFRSGLDAGTSIGKGAVDGLKRVAFLIGEGDYNDLSNLPNARRDAAVMAHALAEMGFDIVEVAENLGKVDLRSVPGIIADRAADADIVLVFFAGHGIETGGVNYLIPVDADPESDKALATDALALQDLAAAASKARRGSLVIIDACRDDPFIEARAVALSRGPSTSQGRGVPSRFHSGLAPPPAVMPNGVVLHSTQPGQKALDGDGLDSPFVRSLLETLAAPGQPFGLVVRETTRLVSDRTQGRQVPAAYGAAPMVALLPPAAAR